MMNDDLLQLKERQGNMKFEPYDPSFKSPLCTLKQISCELVVTSYI